MNSVLVTATSFMRSENLRHELQIALANSPRPPKIEYLDLREHESQRRLLDPTFTSQISSWLVGSEKVTAQELDRLPNLKQLSKYGVGVDNIDFAACQSRGISVHFEAGVNAVAVAEHTLGLIITLTRNLYSNSSLLKDGIWNKNGGKSIQGLKVGIVGLGHVGSKLAKALSFFGADLSYCDILGKPEQEEDLKIRRLSFDDLLLSNELLSFHVPLTDQTYRMMNAAAFERLAQPIYLVNTSRGAVVDQEALKHALNTGKVKGAALDVFESEPFHDRELAGHKNFIGTPHTAGNSLQAVELMGRAAIRGISQFYSLREP